MSEISSLVLPVPVCLIYKKDHLIIEDLVKFEESLSWSERTLDSPANELVSAFFISDNYVETAWRITPTIFENVQLDLAVRFLNASQVDFYISPSQIEEINNNSDSIPRTGFEQSKMENALQNAFKAIESILGDPPKSDEKFFRKMEATGLDPLEEVGYIQKHQLHRVIREMNLARDKKAAHGSTSQRNITFSEMLEYQACARHVILTAIEKKLGHSIFA